LTGASDSPTRRSEEDAGRRCREDEILAQDEVAQRLAPAVHNCPAPRSGTSQIIEVKTLVGVAVEPERDHFAPRIEHTGDGEGERQVDRRRHIDHSQVVVSGPIAVLKDDHLILARLGQAEYRRIESRVAVVDDELPGRTEHVIPQFGRRAA
jgi:hypothetical protein